MIEFKCLFKSIPSDNDYPLLLSYYFKIAMNDSYKVLE